MPNGRSFPRGGIASLCIVMTSGDEAQAKPMVMQAVFALSLPALIALVAVFVFGGIVKGVTGVGLPLVLVPLATQFVHVPVAVALVSVSMVVTNIVQSVEGGHTAKAVRHLLPIQVPL